MRKKTLLMQNWKFSKPGSPSEAIDLPHTWNAIDGQDGGNDYWRGMCIYEKTFPKPEFDSTECVYIQFEGVNSSADIILNDQILMHHDGGYSTFRADITEHLCEGENHLIVKVDNGINDRVYPQKADFTFYGGIYRDVTLIVLDKNHFSMDYFGSTGLEVIPEINENDLSNCKINVKSFVTGKGIPVIKLYDMDGNEVLHEQVGKNVVFEMKEPHLWNGLKDPYLYTAKAVLVDEENGQKYDEVEAKFGIRTFKADARHGFFLNGKPYPLYGVSRHQDRKGIGNALTKEMHDEDMALIKEMGCNSIRLAHYQHDQYFYDLCDKNGMVVWAEIPYISEHMPAGRENTISQMKELILQNKNHASIICWGISNEITISTKDNKDMLDNHKMLNDLCHSMDSTRLTTLACYAMCGPFNKVAHITDLVSWNLYLGWYVPGLKLNDFWLDFFHKTFPNRLLGYSEYGAEGMPNLHSDRPRRGDHTEEYQAIYHEYMLECFKKRPWMWATHVWNMFDFAADARDQGGEPGMNHKGLVTFDRKTKKDSFYLYKAYWSDDSFVHICSKRFRDRVGDKLRIKVYSNIDSITLFVNGKRQETKTGGPVFNFEIPFIGNVHIAVRSTNDNSIIDSADFVKTDTPNPSYKLAKSKGKGSANWV
ncbi:MAG: glycoside hydrolase family 2 protein [Butyrivibrio sp.]|nr:glycoside hydrolase family 2 protein [Butyrivibrio sp.]